MGLISIFCFGTVLISSRTVVKINKQNEELKNQYNDKSEELESLNRKLNLIYNSESKVLSNIMLVNWENDSIPIKKLINEPRLIYRVYDETCVECFEDELDILKELGKEIGVQKIFIITDKDLIDMKAILSRKGMNIPFFKYKKRFNLPFDKKELNPNDVATFFILDSNLKTDMVYIAGGNQDISLPYYKRIKQYFQDQF